MNAHAGGDRSPRGEPAMAFLMIGQSFRPVCLGCSQRLHEQGMLVLVKEVPFSERQPEFTQVIYAIAEGYDLLDCQAAIRDRHTGQPWGT